MEISRNARLKCWRDASTFEIHGKSATQSAATSNAMMASIVPANGIQKLAVVIMAKRTLGSVVSHHQVARARRIDADFRLEKFNLNEPTPIAICMHVR